MVVPRCPQHFQKAGRTDSASWNPGEGSGFVAAVCLQALQQPAYFFPEPEWR